ncbi:MAG: hypothetical protein JWM14_1570 [Chitinophagaceae bacterium]|nr:hypothetical protein [Chitinophagaceae bacterium]
MKPILFFILTLLSISICQSQSTDWKKYLPAQPVDSIVFLSTNKSGPRVLTAKDSSSLSQKELQQVAVLNEKIITAFKDERFPMNDYSSYLEVYEIKQQVHTPKEIITILELFPNYHCAEIPSGGRCIPDYRDCVLFFYQSKPVYALKICFGCEVVDSTPETYEAKCLAERTPLNKISTEWIKRNLIDLFERQ